MGKNLTRYISIRVSPDMHAQLTRSAQADHRPLANFVELLVMEAFRARGLEGVKVEVGRGGHPAGGESTIGT